MNEDDLPQDLSPEESELKNRLQRAVRGVEPPPFLAAKVRARIRESGEPPWYRRPWFASVAAAVATAVVAIGVFLPALTSRKDEDSFLTAALGQVSNLIGLGLGDHIHCALFAYPEGFPGGNQPGRPLDPEFQPVKQIVADHAPSGYAVSLAHHCRFDQRRFTHVTLKNGDSLISLVITSKQDGEGFTNGELQAALSEEGMSFYQEAAGDLKVAAFETSGHLVYVVSDLSEEQNTEMLVAMSSEIQAVLAQVEL